MPSELHDALVALFRDCPDLVRRLLRDKLPAPPNAKLQLRSEDTTQPASTRAYRADLALELATDRSLLIMGLEVQLRRDSRKLYTWPHYAAALRARHRCPVMLIVVCVDGCIAPARVPDPCPFPCPFPFPTRRQGCG
jgi:hypothetical protein